MQIMLSSCREQCEALRSVRVTLNRIPRTFQGPLVRKDKISMTNNYLAAVYVLRTGCSACLSSQGKENFDD